MKYYFSVEKSILQKLRRWPRVKENNKKKDKNISGA